MVADPGALDPQMSAVSALFQLSLFAYDNLVSVDADGEIGIAARQGLELSTARP